MSTKAKRDLLFKRSRPLVRRFDPVGDMWVLWGAYDLESFPNLPNGLVRGDFEQMVIRVLMTRSACLVVEDNCHYFKSGWGPVCFVVVDNYGWRVEPHVDFFRWATPRMILRCNVAFFQMARYSKELGVCEVRTTGKHVPLYRKVCEYGLLHEVGRIPNGDRDGDCYLFSVKGQKNAGTHGARFGEFRGIQRDGDSGRQAGGSEERSGELPRAIVSGEQGWQVRDRQNPEISGVDRGWEGDAPRPAESTAVAAAGCA